MSATTDMKKPREEPRFSDASLGELHRRDFPILSRQVHGKPLVYLDSANTTQKPEAVLERMERYYREENANIHRGTHSLARAATQTFERARLTVAKHLNAAADDVVTTQFLRVDDGR